MGIATGVMPPLAAAPAQGAATPAPDGAFAAILAEAGGAMVVPTQPGCAMPAGTAPPPSAGLEAAAAAAPPAPVAMLPLLASASAAGPAQAATQRAAAAAPIPAPPAAPPQPAAGNSTPPDTAGEAVVVAHEAAAEPDTGTEPGGHDPLPAPAADGVGLPAPIHTTDAVALAPSPESRKGAAGTPAVEPPPTPPEPRSGAAAGIAAPPLASAATPASRARAETGPTPGPVSRRNAMDAARAADTGREAANTPELPAALPRTEPVPSPPASAASIVGADAHQRRDPAAAARTEPLPDPRITPAIDAAGAPAPAPAIDPPRAPPPGAPARQVLPAVVAVAIGGGGRITVMLEPGELGRVEISIERSTDAPQVVILAERPETLALLQRDQRELDRALTQAGLQAEGRTLSFGLSGGDAGSGQPQRQRDGARTARGVQGLEAAASPGTVPAPRLALSLLDLAI